MSEVVVVGGGLAGGGAAIRLARAGLAVHLLEREREPVDKICGEFLSIEAQRALDRLGADLDQLGASRISTLRLAWGSRRIEASLPFVARGLGRKRLDAALLDLAERTGAKIDRGVAVRAVEPGRLVTTRGDLAPTVTFAASGKHDVRGISRDVAGCDTDYVGFKVHLRLPVRARADLDGKVDVILFEDGYAGLQLIEDGIANLCLLITKRRLSAIGGTWRAVFEMLLREPYAAMLADAEEIFARPLTIAGVPYGYLHRDSTDDRVFRLGDQAAVIPSFCGEGMAIALRSAALAASVVVEGGDAAAYHAMLRRDLRRSMAIATTLQRCGRTALPRHLLLGLLRIHPDAIGHLIRATRVAAC
ncbi:NAD(P)/FAD-dependent oxidoreductase [Sphingomonas oryzagri]|uniref:FAD-dependent monooxygenase n=1 Tax=Sphingomonas oryzagri TaxID=3042314 RepID=A0ABT6MXJ4_9SPHN|nr:FAD-dependent monooxygenase [Sphingomonas oryzagri]MDH7637769.1 FAD-dependent monooxygenase [Sphingomonas oryzagri]